MKIKSRIPGVAMVAATLICASVASAQTTYTWNGGTDLNWSNTANWVSGILPVDDTPGAGNAEGITMPYDDIIEFSGTTMPTNNLPGIGAFYVASGANTGNTPRVVLNSGGEIDLYFVGHDDAVFTNEEDPGQDRAILTVGDGIGGGTEDVIVNWYGGAQISRHGNNNIFRYIINSDGTLYRNGGLDFCRGASRVGIMTINGGTVVATGVVTDMDEAAASVINFSELGSSFQAGWGGDYGNLPTVEGSIGVKFLNTSGVAGSELIASSVGGGWKLELLSSNDVANLYTTYTWTGAVDGNWSNAANWDANGIPVDDTPDTTNSIYSGLTMPYKDSIVFDGTMMPTSNIPLVGNWYDPTAVQGDSPTMVFNSGGEIDLDVTKGQFSAFLTNPANDTRSILTVGDGIGGGTDDVIVNVTVGETNALNGSLNRHNNGTHDYTVKSDGTLNIENAVTNFVDLSYNTGLRIVTFTIDGGAVVINDAVNDLSGNCKVSFTSGGGTFTAQYGQDFPDIASVVGSLGTSFEDATGNPFVTLLASDVDGTNFMVSVTASINWGPAKIIDSDLNVSTRGTLAYAYNAGTSTDTTLNGVLFKGASSPAAFGTDITLTQFDGTTFGYGSITNDPYASLDAAYKLMLESAVTNGAGKSTITLNNLTAGKQYLVQLWVNDSSAANAGAQDAVLSAGTASETTLVPATPAAEGGVGQYAIGTFLASGTSQAFEIQSDRLQLNGIQVRQINDVNAGFWTGVGGATWDASTTANFAINAYDAALNNTTFDVAKAAADDTVTFADSYWDNGSTVAVTENSVAISGNVEAGTVFFENSSVDYSLSGGTLGGSTEVVVAGGGTVTLQGDDLVTSTGTLTIDNSKVVSQRNSLRGFGGDFVLDGGEISATGNHLDLANRPITLAAGGGTIRHINNRNVYNITDISGSGTLTVAGVNTDAGRVQLAGTASTYTGGTIIRDGGQAWPYGDGAFGLAGTPVTCINNGDIQPANNINFGTRPIIIQSGTTDIKGGKNATFGGTISGAGALNLTGGGSAYFSGHNTYSGGTAILRYVRATHSDAFGTGDVTLDNADDGSQLQNWNSDPEFANNFIIDSEGGELKAGWGKSLSINGTITGTGPLNIENDSGTVYFNGDGSGYTGTLTVEPDADVGGAGSLGTSVTIQTNSVVRPGARGAIGTLTIAGDLTFVGSAKVEVAVGDSLAVGGNLTLDDTTLDLSGTLVDPATVIATYGGTLTGNFVDTNGVAILEGDEIQPGFTISYTGGEIAIGSNVPYESPTVAVTIGTGGIAMSWTNSIHAGDQFNVYTNSDLQFGAWGVDPSFDIFENGGNFWATNSIGLDPTLFYKLEYP